MGLTPSQGKVGFSKKSSEGGTFNHKSLDLLKTGVIAFMQIICEP